VQLNRCEEALLVTEKYRIKAKTSSHNTRIKSSPDYHKINSVESILDIVNKQKASVLYFSIASGYLFSWLIIPNKGKFVQLFSYQNINTYLSFRCC